MDGRFGLLPRSALRVATISGFATLLLFEASEGTSPPFFLFSQASSTQEVTSRTLEACRQLLKDGHYPEAESLARNLLDDAESNGGSESVFAAEVLDLLVEALWRGGKAQQPETLVLARRAVSIKEAKLGADRPEVAWSLNNLGIVLKRAGDYSAALPIYERALAIREKNLGPEHPDVAQSLNNLAILLDVTGDYIRARPFYERALTIREKKLGSDHPDVAKSLNNLAILISKMGDYDGARPLFERALDIWTKAYGPDHPDVAACLDNLAILFTKTGDYVRAKSLAERALATWTKVVGPDHPSVAESLDNLADVLSALGQYDEAKPLLQRALGIREETLGGDHPDVATSLNDLAVLLLREGEFKEAQPRLERALGILEKAFGPHHPEVADTLNHLAVLLWETGQDSEALADALRAEEISREHLRLMTQESSERQALRYAAVRTSGLDLSLSLAARGTDPASRRAVWDALIRSRALVLDEMATRERVVGGSSDREIVRLAEALSSSRQRLANLATRGPGQDVPVRYLDLLEQADQEKERAEQALAERSVTFQSEWARSRVGLKEVAGALPADSSLVAYVRYGDLEEAPHGPSSRIDVRGGRPGLVPRTDAIRITPSYLALVLMGGEGEPIVVPLGPADRIEFLVRKWRNEMATAPPVLGVARMHAVSRYREVGARLRRAVWDPVATHLQSSKRVFVVPDGVLHLVSLVSLPTRDDRYLIEDGPLLHVLSTERDLVRFSGGVSKGKGLLVLGGVDFNAGPEFAARGIRPSPAAHGVVQSARKVGVTRSSHDSLPACADFRELHFPPLPASRREADQIAALWKSLPEGVRSDGQDVLELTGREAGEAAFRKAAPGHRIVHVATHGFFRDDRCAQVLGVSPLLLSGLALAGANERSDSGGGQAEDGVLTSEEIASMDLSEVEWVVLSACDTGLGRIQLGEGVLGLRRAFEIAGARTLIMSLWRVGDEAAREWMGRLYESRLAGQATAEAVRTAGLEILRERRHWGRSTHPFFWGAFVSTGDWR